MPNLVRAPRVQCFSLPRCQAVIPPSGNNVRHFDKILHLLRHTLTVRISTAQLPVHERGLVSPTITQLRRMERGHGIGVGVVAN